MAKETDVAGLNKTIPRGVPKFVILESIPKECSQQETLAPKAAELDAVVRAIRNVGNVFLTKRMGLTFLVNET